GRELGDLRLGQSHLAQDLLIVRTEIRRERADAAPGAGGPPLPSVHPPLAAGRMHDALVEPARAQLRVLDQLVVRAIDRRRGNALADAALEYRRLALIARPRGEPGVEL